MSKETLGEQIWNGFADGIADIREKVVEEPWYGRVVNERDSAAPEWPQAREPEFGASVTQYEREIDRDIDR